MKKDSVKRPSTPKAEGSGRPFMVWVPEGGDEAALVAAAVKRNPGRLVVATGWRGKDKAK